MSRRPRPGVEEVRALILDTLRRYQADGTHPTLKSLVFDVPRNATQISRHLDAMVARGDAVLVWKQPPGVRRYKCFYPAGPEERKAA